MNNIKTSQVEPLKGIYGVLTKLRKEIATLDEQIKRMNHPSQQGQVD